MDEDVKIVISATDKASDKIKNIGKTGKTTFTELSSVIGLANRAWGAAQGFIRDTAGETLNYANQVRELTIAIGATPQEASKLIQVADDMGIEFSKLTGALEAGIRKGIKPTVENIANLSDQYLALAPGVERTEFLMSKFGRTGQDLARLMELGSDRIAEMGDEIEGTARLMDQDALDAAEDYRLALDNMNDTVTDLKLSIGRGLIPELNNLAQWAARNTNAYNATNEAYEKGIITKGEWIRANSFLFGSEAANLRQVEEVEKKLAVYNAMMNNRALASRGVNRATQEVTASTRDLSDATAIAAGVEGDFANITAEAAKQLIFKKASADLDAAATRRLAEAMGIWSQESYDVITGLEDIRAKLDAGKITSDQYTTSIKNFTAAWNALNSLGQVKDFMIRVALETSERVAAWGGETNPYAPQTTPKKKTTQGTGQATGGYIPPGAYVINENSSTAPETFVSGGGRVLTKQDAQAALGGTTINIYTLPGQNENAIAARVVAVLSRNSGRGRAGLGYAGA